MVMEYYDYEHMQNFKKCMAQAKAKESEASWVAALFLLSSPLLSRKCAKYIILFLLILLADLVQNVAGLSIEIAGIRCFFLIPTALCLSIDEDEKVAAFMGLFAGLLWDLTSLNHLGFNCIYIMLACFIVSTLETYIIRNNFLNFMFVSTFFTLLYSVLYWLFFIVIKGVDGAVGSIGTFYLPSAVYTIIIGAVLYPILFSIKNKICKKYK